MVTIVLWSQMAHSFTDQTGPWFIAVGASGADGLQDIRALLSTFDSRLNAIVMVVLHRPFARPSYLREVLAQSTTMRVIVAQEGEDLQAGHCYIGEPADHLTLLARSLGGLKADPGKGFRNRTVDLLFRSVAEHGRDCTIGVVLSGDLDDGSRGLEAIHRAGGKTMVLLRGRQQQRGMPENAIIFDGPIDIIGSVEQISKAIRDAVHRGGD